MVAERTKDRLRERPGVVRLQGRRYGDPRTRRRAPSGTVAPLVAEWQRLAVHRGQSWWMDFNSGGFSRRRSPPRFVPRLEGCQLLWQLDSGWGTTFFSPPLTG